jgi:AraC-like DNA-binding protein
MLKSKSLQNMDLDIKIPIGNIIINVLYINYEAPNPTWGFSTHSHSSYELHIIPSGEGILHAFNRDFTITPGTLYLTGPGIFHEQKADKLNPMSEYCINFEIDLLNRKRKKNDNYIQTEVDEIFQTLTNTHFWFGGDEFLCSELFEKIMIEFEGNKMGYYTYIQSLILQIILNAIRGFSLQKVSNYHIPKKILNDSRRFIVDDYFKDFCKPLCSKELALKIGTSIRQLNRIIRDYYSMTFQEKLTVTRLEHARDLLINTDLCVSDVSERSGFSNSNYFCIVFTKHNGVSPSKYRKQNMDLKV